MNATTKKHATGLAITMALIAIANFVIRILGGAYPWER